MLYKSPYFPLINLQTKQYYAKAPPLKSTDSSCTYLALQSHIDYKLCSL